MVVESMGIERECENIGVGSRGSGRRSKIQRYDFPITPTPSSTMVHRTIAGSVIVLWET
jgi:hypothetical protein